MAARLHELPPVPYAHMVFTVPCTLAEHCQAQPETLYRALFNAASQAVLQLFRQRHGTKPGIIAVLHTWGQNLHFHPHIHLIVTAGGLDTAGQWKPTPEGYVLPVKALSGIFRAKCFNALEKLGQDLPAKRLPKQWVVHARPAQGTPGSILLYLARYVYRVAIDESRILEVGEKTVTFRYKDYQDQEKTKTMTLDGTEFLRRFLQHILPDGFVKVRHYGLFAHATKPNSLEKLRSSLPAYCRSVEAATKAILALLASTTTPPPPPQCPRCQSQDLTATEVLPLPQAMEHWPQAP